MFGGKGEGCLRKWERALRGGARLSVVWGFLFWEQYVEPSEELDYFVEEGFFYLFTEIFYFSFWGCFWRNMGNGGGASTCVTS